MYTHIYIYICVRDIFEKEISKLELFTSSRRDEYTPETIQQ